MGEQSASIGGLDGAGPMEDARHLLRSDHRALARLGTRLADGGRREDERWCAAGVWLARALPASAWAVEALRAPLRWGGCGQRGPVLYCNSTVVFWAASGELENDREGPWSLVASTCACRASACARLGKVSYFRIK